MCTINPQVKNIIVPGCLSLSFSFDLNKFVLHFLGESLALLICPLSLFLLDLAVSSDGPSQEEGEGTQCDSKAVAYWSGAFGWNWVIAYRSQACDKMIWMIRHRKWSWHSERVRVVRWNPLEAHYSVVFVLICLIKRIWVVSSLWVSPTKDEEEAEEGGDAWVWLYDCRRVTFGVPHLVPTSVALLEEEEWRFLWRPQQHGHLVLMRDPYLQIRRQDYSPKNTKSEQLVKSFC